MGEGEKNTEIERERISKQSGDVCEVTKKKKMKTKQTQKIKKYKKIITKKEKHNKTIVHSLK